MRLEVFSSDEWKQYAAEAHWICFGEERSSAMNRINFCLMTAEDGLPQVYMTVRETDSETAYINYGGAFPSAKDSTKSFKSFQMMMDYLKARYHRAHMLVENTNVVMIKFGLKAGMLITGFRQFKDSSLLELSIEWGEPCGTC